MNDKKFDEIIEALADFEQSFKRVTSTMSTGPASFYFEKMKEYYKGCMKAAKFKKGSRVKLKEDYTGKDTGWQHCKHFLKKGALATVKEADYRDGKYIYSIMFDNESWLRDSVDFVRLKEPIEMPVKDKHVFLFYQSDLEKA